MFFLCTLVPAWHTRQVGIIEVLARKIVGVRAERDIPKVSGVLSDIEDGGCPDDEILHVHEMVHVRMLILDTVREIHYKREVNFRNAC